MGTASQASGPNPLELKNHKEVEPNHEYRAIKTAEQPVSEDTNLSEKHGEPESNAAEAPEIRKLGKHHSTDKSVAGGGVIIAGLVTAIFGAVVCYIRVTRRKDTAR